MRVIPAIDLRGGLCVRLRQGDYDRETVFSNDPALMAARWEAEGATLIHLVDLDGAKSGRPVNVGAVRRILERVGVPCQLGGGIRDAATIDRWLRAGLDRVIVGTQALRDPDWFRSMAENYPAGWYWGSMPARARSPRRVGSRPREWTPPRWPNSSRGSHWPGSSTRTSRATAPSRARTLTPRAALAERVKTPVIASGGVGCLADLQRLARLPIAGCIVGRALYEGMFSLVEAIAHVEAVPLRGDSR